MNINSDTTLSQKRLAFAINQDISKVILFTLLLSVFYIFSATVSLGQDTKTDAKPAEAKPEVVVEAPKVLAVEFYADWCGVCKELMPRLAELRKSYQSKHIMVVRFDMTDDYTKAQASFMASYSGLAEVYKKGGGKTGFVALVNAANREVLGLITKKKTDEEIAKLVEDALAKADAAK